MKILLIETGLPPSPVGESFGNYPNMFKNLLGNEIRADYEVCSIIRGDKVPDFNMEIDGKFDGIVILGSPHSVYEDIDWINQLKEVIRQAAQKKIPQIGICFGHQLIADALGGVVKKAPQGWGIGRHSYKIIDNNEVLKASSSGKLNLLVSHQDQVLQRPKSAKVIAASDFTPNAILLYKEERIITSQAHPEFSSDFIHELISSRRGTKFCEKLADEALKDVHEPADGDVLAKMFAAHFLGQKEQFIEHKRIA